VRRKTEGVAERMLRLASRAFVRTEEFVPAVACVRGEQLSKSYRSSPVSVTPAQLACGATVRAGARPIRAIRRRGMTGGLSRSVTTSMSGWAIREDWREQPGWNAGPRTTAMNVQGRVELL